MTRRPAALLLILASLPAFGQEPAYEAIPAMVTMTDGVVLDATLGTRALYLVPGHESSVALRAKNILDTRGPDPGFSGFEYPLRPMEVFLELRHQL